VADSVVNRYRIIDLLDTGGMGQVFLAEDSKLRRKVALKKLSPSLDSNRDVRRRLLHEARAAARINHPRIASIYDVVEINDGAFIVMEYVPGETLAAKLVSGALPPDQVLGLATQAAEAIAAAHAQGVVHGDLKPANIHVNPEGDLKIIDFGLARMRHYESSAASNDPTSSMNDLGEEPGALAGTLPYMPPEAFEGRPADVRGDVYSLGVTLFELLTGRRPFTGDSRLALVHAISTQPTPRAAEIDARVPEPLSAVVSRAMARSPADRHQTAAELLDDLRRIGKGKSKAATIVTVATTLVASVLVAFLVTNRDWKSREIVTAANVVAVLPFLSISPDSNALYIASGMSDVVSTNLASLPLAVVPSGQTARYGKPDREIAVLTRELGASMVVDGSVQQYGNQLRVTVRLIRAGSGKLDWSRTFDGDVSAILALQEDVLVGLADGLKTTGFLDENEAASRKRLARLPTSDEVAYADYIQARSFLDRKDVAENILRAIRLFDSAGQRDTTFVQALGGLGEAYWAQYRKTRELNWAEKAVDATRTAAARQPDNMMIRYSLAVILEGTGKYDEARVELSRIVAAQRDNDGAHSLLGGVYDKLGRKEDALREFRTAVALRPAYWWHHWRLGTFYFNNSRLDEGVAAAKRVTELQPDNARGFQLLGVVYQAQGRIAEALEAYQACLRISPTGSAYSNIGGIHFDQRDYPRAIEFYQKAVETDPRLPVYRRNLGDALFESGRRETAIEQYMRAIELSGDILKVNAGDTNTMSLLALCLAKAGRPDSSLKMIGEAVRLTPSSNYVLYKQSAIYALLDRKTEALQTLKSALAAGASPREAAKDPDLKSIADTREFKALVTM
jgi:eukaryotic-like serine/threonine-protein kinase